MGRLLQVEQIGQQGEAALLRLRSDAAVGARTLADAAHAEAGPSRAAAEQTASEATRVRLRAGMLRAQQQSIAKNT